MVVELILINGGEHRQGISSIVNRPDRHSQDPFARFGDRTLCTHFDLAWKKPLEAKLYRTEAEAGEGAEPVRITCKNKRGRSSSTGFLCDFHASTIPTGKVRKVSPKPDFMTEARDVVRYEAAAIKSSKVERVRLITAGVKSVYLKLTCPISPSKLF